MAYRAFGIVRRFPASHGLGDSRRARVGQNNECASVKISSRPNTVLLALRSGPSMATGRFAAGRPDEFSAFIARLPDFFCETSRRTNRNDDENAPQHGARLAPCPRAVQGTTTGSVNAATRSSVCGSDRCNLRCRSSSVVPPRCEPQRQNRRIFSEPI